MAHRTGKKGALVALLAAGSLTLGAAPSLAGPAIIKAGAFGQAVWSPKTKVVTKGKKVVWINPPTSGQAHNIHAYGGNWTFHKPLASGARRSRRFTKLGTFRYKCTIHTGMVGKIRVTT